VVFQMNDNKNMEKSLAKEKVIKVIKSCVSLEHSINAKKYLDLFFNKFQDKETYRELWDFWKKSTNKFK